MGDDELFGYAGCIAMGHALNHAAFLGATVEQLAVWDGVEAGGNAGTAHDVAAWRKTGRPTHIIELPASETRVGFERTRPTVTRRIGAILFSDFHGFGRLRDEHFPIFIDQVLTPLAAIFDREPEVIWRNSWGDAIAAVLTSVDAAARCALSLHETLGAIDLAACGLPSDLDLRLGAHAGPVITITDPITGRATCWGRELTRAARIEPRTPEGQVYVTDAFAALLALQPHTDFATEYVGRITTAKAFETIPMYRLYRRTTPSAGEPG